MCLITYAPKGANTLDWNTLKHSYTKMNDDGFGISWFNFETGLWEVWRSMRSHRLDAAVDKIPQDVPLVIHQRFATHGSKTMANCHPFAVGDTGALLFHNGTIKGTRADWSPTKGSKCEDISDTRAYIEDELAPMLAATGAHLLLNERMSESIGSRIRGSVLAITLPGDPVPVIINEYLGDWENGLYYSNTYSRPYVSMYDDDAYWRKQADGSYGWEWEDEEPKKGTSRLIGFRGYGTADANDESPERAAKALDDAEALCDLHFERDNRPYDSADDDETLTPQERYERLTLEEQEWAEWYAEQEDIDDDTADYLEAQYGIPVKRKVA